MAPTTTKWLDRTSDDRQGERESILRGAGFGGFLGLGNDHYPLPWQSLKYDTRLGGYVTGVTEKQLRGAPKFGEDRDSDWTDAARNRALDDYYGVPIV
jgi:hypothetical protein